MCDYGPRYNVRMNRIALLGVVLLLSVSCGGGPGDGDAGDDAGLAFDAGADAGTDAGVTKHKYDCTLHAMCDLPDGGTQAVDAGVAAAACGSDAPSVEARDAGAFCTLLNSDWSSNFPQGTVCYACALSDCEETADACQ